MKKIEIKFIYNNKIEFFKRKKIMHFLGIQDEDFDLTLNEYISKLDIHCKSLKELKKKYDYEELKELYKNFIINEINNNDIYKLGDIVWIYPYYYTSRMYYGYNNIVLNKNNQKSLEINENILYDKN